MRNSVIQPFFSIVFLSLALMITPVAQAAEPITVSHAWVRATAPGQKVGAAYINIQSSTDATLTRVESPVADSVEIHSMTMNDGVMKMRMLENLALPAGKTVKLEPGGFHLMLFGLKKPLSKDEQIAFSLHFKLADGTITRLDISAPVQAVAHQH